MTGVWENYRVVFFDNTIIDADAPWPVAMNFIVPFLQPVMGDSGRANGSDKEKEVAEICGSINAIDLLNGLCLAF